ncbi:hypothetical protein AAFF_G00129400 [Aldrovandia affinis]|uniref:FISNA domain-containing protein n=1 Tax=Aldrovandia affinis TaxID=143900 RepID=A0AAD7WY77_9TELE|nr:hypothetical protein AAFF_G00129400 [Aldrovandia affinis]
MSKFNLEDLVVEVGYWFKGSTNGKGYLTDVKQPRFRRLLEAFSDPMIEVYLLFFQATIPAFTSFKLLLQREQSSIFLLHDEMTNFICKLCSKFIVPTVLLSHREPHYIPYKDKANQMPGAITAQTERTRSCKRPYVCGLGCYMMSLPGDREEWLSASEMSFSRESFEDDEEGEARPERDIFLLPDRAIRAPMSRVRPLEDRVPSPALSYESMRSDERSDDEFGDEPFLRSLTRIQLERPNSPASSCHSMESVESRESPAKPFWMGPRQPVQKPEGTKRSVRWVPLEKAAVQVLLGITERRHPAMNLAFMLKALLATLKKLVEGDRRYFKKCLVDRYPEIFESSLLDHDVPELVDKMLERCDMEGSLKITLLILSDMKLQDIAKFLQGMCKRHEVQYELKASLRKKYTCIFEGLAKQGCSTLFNKIYAELCVTMGKTGGVNTEHEELNLMKAGKYSLMQLLHSFFPEMRELETIESNDDCKVLIICDGLDECQLPLDFQHNGSWCDVKDPTSLDMLLTNLIKGNLLSSALRWIISRPAATNRIPPDYVLAVAEVEGFNDAQKEEYFKKRISDQNLANRVVTHLQSTRSLHIMCRIPMFCWTASDVLQRAFLTADGETPKALTEIFTHFLFIQLNNKDRKYHGKELSQMCEEEKEFLMKVGKLAFQMLENNQVIVKAEQWKASGIGLQEGVVHSGLCVELFKEVFVMYHEKVYCFMHLYMQEYLAALYTFLSFKNSNRNVLDQPFPTKVSRLLKKPNLFDLHKSAVDMALRSQNGHLDMFLRFLLGLSIESNQNLLRGIVTQVEGHEYLDKTVQYIRKKMRENHSAERRNNLTHCLVELQPYPSTA